MTGDPPVAFDQARIHRVECAREQWAKILGRDSWAMGMKTKIARYFDVSEAEIGD